MLRGTPVQRTSTFSSATSTTRGFETNTGSVSSSASCLLRPLQPEDVVIEVIIDDSRVASLSPPPGLLEAEAQHVVERSFFVVPLDSHGRPTRRPTGSMKVVLNEIDVSVSTTPEESLLFGSSMLKADEISHITDWLVGQYSLESLQRMSVQIVQDLEMAQERDPRLGEAIEQRALVVAEATGRRASDEAARDDNHGGGLRRTTRGMAPDTGSSRRETLRRQRKLSILQEKQSIEDTLAQFNQKIAMFATEDPATAEMLMPAKLDLENKLRHIRAQLAALGEDTASPRMGQGGDAPSLHGDDIHREPAAARRDQFVPEPYQHDEYMDDESSSEDENDLRMALPIDGSEYDLPFINDASGRDGYVSSDDSEFFAEEIGSSSQRPAADAEFVIDLSTSKTQIGEELVTGDSGHIDLGSEIADQPCRGDLDSDETNISMSSPAKRTNFESSSRGSSPKGTEDYSSDLERNTTPRSVRKGRKAFLYASGSR